MDSLIKIFSNFIFRELFLLDFSKRSSSSLKLISYYQKNSLKNRVPDFRFSSEESK